MSDGQTRAVEEALARTRLTATPGQPISVEPSDIIIAHADRATLVREVERLHGHLERLADAADAGFQRVEEGDSADPETASEVYQWARNYAYAIRHPDEPMGQALTMRTTPPPASAPGDGGERHDPQ